MARVVLDAGTPVNAKSGGCIATVASVPVPYRKPVLSNFELTLTQQPATEVALTPAVGYINMTDVGVNGEQFIVGGQTFTFVTALTEPRAAGEVLIGLGAGHQETLIKIAIELDTAAALAGATEDGTQITVTATTAGDAGNAVIFSTTATNMVMTTANAGFLAGGLDAVTAETIVVDGDTYTFLANGETAGASELAIGTTLAETGDVIATIVKETLTITNVDEVITFTAVAEGVPGDGIAIVTGDVYGTGGVTAGGDLGAIDSIVVNGISYTFVESGTAGETDIETDHPTHVPVVTDSGDTTTDVAIAWVAALKLDTAVFSATSVSNLLNVVTMQHKTTGLIGNAITYVNSLATPADITTTGVTDGLWTGGQIGTEGLTRELKMDDDYLYVCTSTNSAILANWRRISLGEIY